MQYKDKKNYFIKTLGELIHEIRLKKSNLSLSKFCEIYNINKSSLSRIERGFYSIEFITVWKIIEALDIDFIEFAKSLKSKLGEDYKLLK